MTALWRAGCVVAERHDADAILLAVPYPSRLMTVSN